MKPFRRTGFNVPLNCPLPKCRARGSWGILPHACFSCFVLFASSKENEVASAKPASQLIVASEQFRKISPLRLLFLIALTTEEEIDYTINLTRNAVAKLRELSPLWDMFKEGIDLNTIEWSAH